MNFRYVFALAGIAVAGALTWSMFEPSDPSVSAATSGQSLPSVRTEGMPRASQSWIDSPFASGAAATSQTNA
ncbi:MAG: hypothetical protein M3N23_09065, partial [Pseudomonadota bacterium]|nr:hypothetical protein [Pseudomonadota bacterium]